MISLQMQRDQLEVAPVAKLIDHTCLKPEATPAHIAQLCQEAVQYGFATVCVNPAYVALAADLLRESAVGVCTVVGFPLGATTTAVKVFEAERTIAGGATEIDMVINVGLLKAERYGDVGQEIAEVVKTAHGAQALCKVIIETALLTEMEKIQACVLAVEAEADFVKTSTGFSSGGATVADVALMRRTVGPDMGVKAAGGIRTLDDVEQMVAAGATRIGASAGVKIAQAALLLAEVRHG